MSALPAQPGLVSVVIIFLDEERYLSEAVESVRAQDYPHWELLLVDDGSTDDSGRVAQSLADEDARISYLHHPGHANRGMSASRNLGLAHCRGELVAFLDADDVYLPGRLRHHVDVLERQGDVAMVVSDHLRWFHHVEADGTVTETTHHRSYLALGDQIWQPPLGLMVVLAVPYLGLGICNITVRRSAALAVGGFEDGFTSHFEDQAFTSKILARYPVYVMQRHLARYRHHSGSWTRRAKETGAVHRKLPHAETLRFADWLAEHLRNAGVDDELLWDLLHDRARAARHQPGALGSAMIRASAAVQRLGRRVLPRRWYHRMLIIDYERDRRRARRRYDALARRLSRRAAETALAGPKGRSP